MRSSVFLASCTLVLSPAVAWPQNLRVEGKLISAVTSGAPLEVSSTEKVANLNADLLDGLNGSQLATQTQVQALEQAIQLLQQSAARRAYFTVDSEVDEFTVPDGVTLLEVTVIGGGGGGGGGLAELSGGLGRVGGGGGGGSGMVVVTALEVLSGEQFSIDVGAGGLGGLYDQHGGDGESSVLSSDDRPWRVEAAGGKGGRFGGSSDPNQGGAGGDGGFGGGGGGWSAAGGTGPLGNGTAGQGGPAGNGASGGAGGQFCDSFYNGGGGGGGPGGGAGGNGSTPAESGIQPGAGGGGACDTAFTPAGAGAGGAIVIRWLGPAK